MTPKAFLTSLKKAPPAGCLLAGPELFFRDHCLRGLRRAVLGDQTPDDQNLIDIDLKERPLRELLDETRSLSLFATSRLVIGSNAEAAVPGGSRRKNDDAGQMLADYFRDPTPGVTVALVATRFDPDNRDEKAKLDRVLKYFSAVPLTVDMSRLKAAQALRVAKTLADGLKVSAEPGVLEQLVEMLGSDLARLSTELEKLAVYAGEGRQITAQDLESLTPEARQSNLYAFSDALARRDRVAALGILDTLAKSGTYWPLQINMIAGLFRQALAVKEIGRASTQQISAQLARAGIRVWPSRAQQLAGIARQFSAGELQDALIGLADADRDLRRERPSDRLIMEQLVLRLT